jgi:Pet100
MARGRPQLQLEAFKFSIYLGIPILASVTFNSPNVQKYFADYFQFLKYPPNPNTGLQEDFEEMIRKRQLQREQEQQYREQLRLLHESAQKSRVAQEAGRQNETKKRSWYWLW